MQKILLRGSLIDSLGLDPYTGHANPRKSQTKMSVHSVLIGHCPKGKKNTAKGTKL